MKRRAPTDGAMCKARPKKGEHCTVKGVCVAFLHGSVRWIGIRVGMRQQTPVTQQWAGDGEQDIESGWI